MQWYHYNTVSIHVLLCNQVHCCVFTVCIVTIGCIVLCSQYTLLYKVYSTACYRMLPFSQLMQQSVIILVETNSYLPLNLEYTTYLSLY